MSGIPGPKPEDDDEGDATEHDSVVSPELDDDPATELGYDDDDDEGDAKLPTPPPAPEPPAQQPAL